MTLFKLDNYRGSDISDKKIYLDTEMKQFRHKVKCDICGVPVICKCYDTLYEAVEDSEFTCWCNKCSIREAVRDCGNMSLYDIFEVFYVAKNQERVDKIIDFALSLLTEEEINELAKEICDFEDCDEFIGDVCSI